MNRELQSQAEKMNNAHQKRRRWYKILSVPVCLVVFITTYALILPAITLETAPDTTCGYEQHTHTGSCYQTPGVPEHVQYVCQEALTAHSHTDACYDADGVLACGKEETVYRHTHDAFCFDGSGQLICTLPETATPTAEPQQAAEPENADAAIQTVGGDAAVEDAEEETPAGTEDPIPAEDDAVSPPDDPVRDLPAHQHTAQCLETVPAVEPQGLICQLPEHIHTDACFAPSDQDDAAADDEDTLPAEDGEDANTIPAADRPLMELTGAELAAIDDAELARRNDEFMALSDSELDELNRRIADFMASGGLAVQAAPQAAMFALDDEALADAASVPALQAVSVSNSVTVSVSDQVANIGCYVASAADPNSELSGHTVSFSWSRNIDSGSYTTVAKQFYKVNGRAVSNLSGDGNCQLNLALDNGGITDDETSITYQATLYADGQSTGKSGTATNTIYNRSVLNGSFEAPVVSSGVYQQYDYTKYTSDLKWLTTANDRNIEIVRLSSSSSSNSKYTWRGLYGNNDYSTCVYATSGNQYAEINAQADSALYQDVVTIPGVTMNWKLSHAKRPGVLGKALDRTVDTMYLCIMPEYMARQEQYQNTATLRNLAIEKIGSGTSYTDPATGVYVQKIQDTASWGTYTGTYSVPDGQYLTRFFFISGDPSSHDLGNFLDDVWFGQELPPLNPTDASITITKTINTALTEAERQQLLYQLTFRIVDNNTGGVLAAYTASELSAQWTEVKTQNQVTGYMLSKQISVNGLIGKTIRVEEANAEIAGYSLAADVPDKTVTVGRSTSETFSFINTYTNADRYLQVQKIASGPDTSGTYAILVSYETSNGETFSQTYSLQSGHSTGRIAVPDNAAVTITEPSHDGYHVTIKNGDTLLADSDTYTFTIISNTDITVYNTASVALPNTGGVPSQLFIFGGLTLVLIAIIGGCVARRRYGKEEA